MSGDGDTGAIGIGQFVHLMRRNVPMIYIVENNGCYGLTKGQLSPTADLGSTLKNGVVNDLPPIDLCALAIDLGASFVARSFSGDKKQMLSLLKAAIAHRGTAMLDIISPCVTFNDHEGSTKSYSYVKDHEEPLEEISFVPFFEDISVDYEPGTVQAVSLHDGSRLFLKKLAGDYDPTNKAMARRVMHESAARGEFATGLIYVEPDRPDFLSLLNVVDEPLASLPREGAPAAERSRRSWRPEVGRARAAATLRPSSFAPITSSQIFFQSAGRPSRRARHVRFPAAASSGRRLRCALSGRRGPRHRSSCCGVQSTDYGTNVGHHQAGRRRPAGRRADHRPDRDRRASRSVPCGWRT